MTTPTTTPSLLEAELAAVRGELARVDGKCSTLAGLAGAALALLIASLKGSDFANPCWWLVGTATLLMAGAALALLTVLRPRLGTTGFRRYAAMTTAQIEGLAHANEIKRTRFAAEDLRTLSEIVNRKYLGLRLAVDLVLAAVVCVAAALVEAVIA
ncbi:Pycsar system effector family protein [Actinoallomurus sp. CA-150999]|uniref:Pycsar system effector family protein n=1 Tax=Actinoallomurus sp. CA-150999 TaxID=3239887 RepID=UPI003D9111FC